MPTNGGASIPRKDNLSSEEPMKESDEYMKFSNLVGALIKVPHSEIKAKLDAEKKAKKPKRKKKHTEK